MRLSDYSGISRWLDPVRYPTHRNVLLIGAGSALVAYGTGFDIFDALLIGAGAFAAWTLTRELDPDRPQSAAIAAIASGLVALVVGVPAVAPVFVAMLTARIVSRSTGLTPRWTDLAVVAAGAIVFAGTPSGWAAGIVLAFGIVRDATLPGRPPPAAAIFAGATAVGVTARVAFADALGTWVAPDGVETAIAVAGLIAGLLLVMRTEPIVSVADFTKEALEPRRIREARTFGLAPAALALAAAGSAGVAAMAPVWISAVSVAVMRRGLDSGKVA